MRSTALKKEAFQQTEMTFDAAQAEPGQKIHYLKIAIQSETACHMRGNKNDVDYEEFMAKYDLRTKGFFE